MRIPFTKVRPFLYSLIGIPYEKWNFASIPRDGTAPFWVSTSPITIREVPNIRSCNCAGLFNLLTRYLGKRIPDVENEMMLYPGGTFSWCTHLKPFLEPYASNLPGIAGTVLLRPYYSKDDQGHLAIVMEDALTIHQAPLLHCHSLGGVTLDPETSLSHEWEGGDYYKFICTWENFTRSLL